MKLVRLGPWYNRQSCMKNIKILGPINIRNK